MTTINIAQITAQKMKAYNKHDIELNIRNETVTANKYLLAIHSEPIKVRFEGNFSKEGMYDFDNDPTTFKKLISLLDNNEATLSHADLIPLINLCDEYIMTELCEKLANTLATQLTPQNVYNTYISLEHEYAKNKCVDFINRRLFEEEDDDYNYDTYSTDPYINDFIAMLQSITNPKHMLSFIKTHHIANNEYTPFMIANPILTWYEHRLTKIASQPDDETVDKVEEYKNHKECVEEMLQLISFDDFTSHNIKWFQKFTSQLKVFDQNKLSELLTAKLKEEAEVEERQKKYEREHPDHSHIPHSWSMRGPTGMTGATGPSGPPV